MQFTKAVRKKAKLRLALTGPSGSGKTWGAITIARSLGGRIAVVDTEKGSASLYSHLADFDVLELAPPFTPERFVEAAAAAVAAGYDVLILDSITHEWNGPGGCLEMVDELARSKYKGNTWRAFDEVTPRHRAFIDSILRSPIHVIATARSKTETAQTEENGRKKVVKLGMKAEQRDGVEYEFTTVLDLVHDGHFATASKDRTGLFTGRDPKAITPATGAALVEWLESGAEPPSVESLVVDFTAAVDGVSAAEDLDPIWERAKAALPEAELTALAAVFRARKKALTGGPKAAAKPAAGPFGKRELSDEASDSLEREVAGLEHDMAGGSED